MNLPDSDDSYKLSSKILCLCELICSSSPSAVQSCLTRLPFVLLLCCRSGCDLGQVLEAENFKNDCWKLRQATADTFFRADRRAIPPCRGFMSVAEKRPYIAHSSYRTRKALISPQRKSISKGSRDCLHSLGGNRMGMVLLEPYLRQGRNHMIFSGGEWL